MSQHRCPHCGESLQQVSFYMDYCTGRHDVYRCANCCNYWSDRWGKQLKPESREKQEWIAGGRQGPFPVKPTAPANGPCVNDGKPASRRLSNGLLACRACCEDWMKKGWILPDGEVTTRFRDPHAG